MSDPSQEIQLIFEREIVPFCDEAFIVAARRTQQDISKAGIVLTSELKDSIESQKLGVTGTLEAEFRMAMRGYGRYKDMKTITYDQFNPDPKGDFIENIKQWVDSKGIGTFKYVPGYFTDSKRRVEIPDSRARNRIAWGVAMGIINKGTIKRRGKFWNKNRGKVYDDIKRMIMERLPDETLNKLISYYNEGT